MTWVMAAKEGAIPQLRGRLVRYLLFFRRILLETTAGTEHPGPVRLISRVASILRISMTMRDQEPLRDLSPTRPKNNKAPWILMAVAFVVVMGIAVYAMNGSKTAIIRTQSGDPAVMTSPAPAAGVPVPPPETTTGQAPVLGPVGTTSTGGAPAGKPQGETPPNMQAVPK
jgi:hypothetical protein